MIKPNTAALIKLAGSVYDMYPDTYAHRHNANNPEHKEQEIRVHEEADNGTIINVPKYTVDSKMGPAARGVNRTTGDNYPGSYHIMTDRPNIEGTGHGIPLGRRPRNPQSYT